MAKNTNTILEEQSAMTHEIQEENKLNAGNDGAAVDDNTNVDGAANQVAPTAEVSSEPQSAAAAPVETAETTQVEATQVQPVEAAQVEPAADAAQPSEAAQPAEASEVAQPSQTVQPSEAQSAQPAASEQAEAQTKYPKVMNLLTGEYTDDNTSSRDRERLIRANRAVENLKNLYDIYPNPTDTQIKDALGADFAAFNYVYGKRSANWANAFGGEMFGVLPRATREGVLAVMEAERQRQSAKEAADKAAAEAAAKATVEVKGVGDATYQVTAEFSDTFKRLAKQYNDVGNGTDEASVAKRQRIIAAMREEMIKAGFPIKPAVEGENAPSTWEELVSLATGDDDATALANEAVLENIMTTALQDRTPKEDENMLIEKARERQERKEAIDLENQNKAIERARLRTGAAGLAALVGDIIRASEGAKVEPRNMKDIYDNLTAQEKANIDNYRVRMQKIKEEALAEKLAGQQAAAKAADRASKERIAAMQEAGRNKRWADKLNNDQLVAAIKAGTKTPSKNGKGTVYDTSVLRVNGTNYYFRPNRYKSIITSIYGVLRKAGVTFNIKDQLTGVPNMSVLPAFVVPYLIGTHLDSEEQNRIGQKGPQWNELDDKYKKEILSIIGEGVAAEIVDDDNDEEEPINVETVTADATQGAKPQAEKESEDPGDFTF